MDVVVGNDDDALSVRKARIRLQGFQPVHIDLANVAVPMVLRKIVKNGRILPPYTDELLDLFVKRTVIRLVHSRQIQRVPVNNTALAARRQRIVVFLPHKPNRNKGGQDRLIPDGGEASVRVIIRAVVTAQAIAVKAGGAGLAGLLHELRSPG